MSQTVFYYAEERLPLSDLIKILQLISNKYCRYYKSDKKPKGSIPFICIKNISENKFIQLKRKLDQNNVLFTDGTYFDGDIFHLDKILIGEQNRPILFKLLTEETSLQIIRAKQVDIIYNLGYRNDFWDKKYFDNKNILIQNIQINSIGDLNNIFK